MGNFGYGDKNDRGERLLEFALEHDMMICNTKISLLCYHKIPQYFLNSHLLSSTLPQITYLLMLCKPTAKMKYDSVKVLV